MVRVLNNEHCLQVWFGELFVGTLDVSGQHYQGRNEYPLSLTPDDDGYYVTRKELHLQIIKRSHAVAKHAVSTLGREGLKTYLRENRVPPYCETEENHRSNELIMRWDAVVIHETHLDRYRQVFDSDQFEPDSDEPDDPEGPVIPVKDPWQISSDPRGFSQTISWNVGLGIMPMKNSFKRIYEGV